MASGQLIQAIIFSLYTIHKKDPQGSVPTIDREVPTSTAEALVLTSTLNHDIGNGEHAVIHRRAGVGRAGMIASAVLMQAGYTSGTAYSTGRQQSRKPEWFAYGSRDLCVRAVRRGTNSRYRVQLSPAVGSSQNGFVS